MSTKAPAVPFEKDPNYCEKTGKFHRWKYKNHGNTAFPTVCVDCKMKAEDLNGEIIAQQKKAEEDFAKAEAERKKKEAEEARKSEAELNK